MIHISLTCVVLGALAFPQDETVPTPPGVILVTGGQTVIGSDIAEVEDLVRKDEGARGAFAGETPRHKVDVPDFYLMPTEVTNEQYGAYVRATGSKPPYYWGEEALLAGLKEFNAEQAAARAEAKADGIRLPRVPFDKQAWWASNWEGKPWKVPEKQLIAPVVLVSYRNVVAYCDWAGLRPMTEFEYQRASRGDTDNIYPWGPEFDETAAATLEGSRDSTFPVGSFPKGARNGIFDLSGNVWEWTASPYIKFPKNDQFTVKTGKGKSKRNIIALANFDPDYRVLVGGSYVSGAIPCRVTTRMGVMRAQAAQGVGFRCAASTIPGKDLADRVQRTDVKLGVLPIEQDVKFYSKGAVVLQRWDTQESKCEIPGYAIISGYENVVFAPSLVLPARKIKALRDKSAKEGPLVLGFLSLTSPTLEPALEAGTYIIAFRGTGPLPRLAKDEVREFPVPGDGLGDFLELDGFDIEADMLILYDVTGVPVAKMPAGTVNEDKMREVSTLTVAAFVPPEPVEGEDPEDVVPVIPMDDLNLHVGVAGTRRGYGFWFDIQFKIAPNTLLNW